MRHFIASLAGTAACVLSAWAMTAGTPGESRAAEWQLFVPRDVKVCPASAGIRDPEFDAVSQRMTFFDTMGRLKVMSIRADGTVASPGCRGGVVVDTGVVSVMPEFSLINGPEWARSQNGTEIFYTKLDVQQQPALARAWKNGSIWQTEFLELGTNRGLPVATMDATDLQTRIFYAFQPPGAAWEWRWRESRDAASEAPFPGVAPRGTGAAPRWVQGQRAIATVVADSNAVMQAARFDVDAATIELLTDDAGDKDEVWMWPAPEFNGEHLFMTVVDNCCLRIYRQLAGVWTVIQTADAASFSDKPFIFSPEPFVYKNRSYVVMRLSRQKYSPADLWILAVDPANPLLRQVTDPTLPDNVRSEPEFMATPNGAFIYYTMVEGVDKASLYRADTGL